MSHKATNWAVSVRGIPATAKVVLWHLADRHNKETGRCDPSQDLLAEDCEISRSTLNNHLNLLEEKGFIKRIQRVNSATKRQQSTAYILNFDVLEPQDDVSRVQDSDTGAVSDLDGEPCPISSESRVQNLDTNLGREPGKNRARSRAVSSVLDFDAKAIREGKRHLVGHVTAVQARSLIEKNQVTEEQCKAVGLI